jgi:hypothetical protein
MVRTRRSPGYRRKPASTGAGASSDWWAVRDLQAIVRSRRRSLPCPRMARRRRGRDPAAVRRARRPSRGTRDDGMSPRGGRVLHQEEHRRSGGSRTFGRRGDAVDLVGEGRQKVDRVRHGRVKVYGRRSTFAPLWSDVDLGAREEKTSTDLGRTRTVARSAVPE